MSAKEKLIKKIMQNPTRNDITYLEAKSVLLNLGFKEVSINGSHHKFVNFDIQKIFIIPVHGKCIKPVYVNKIKEYLDEYIWEEK